MTPPDTGIQLRTIGSLDGHTFHVPSYQRGYRWTQTQVSALLDDLLAWSQTDPNPVAAKDGTKKAPAYCLQPLVVVPRPSSDTCGNTFEVVDGQQRLTTLYLILENLGVFHPSQPKMPRFTLCYDRHSNGVNPAGELSLLIESGKSADDTPDLYFIRTARETIAAWMGTDTSKAATLADLFRIRSTDTANRFLKKTPPLADLLFAPAGNDLRPCVQFIWHQLHNPADGIPAFERLNSGKIPLTDAELIRGLLLRRGSAADDATRQRIALRWDQMERRLRDDEFWAFLGGDLAAKKTPEFGVCRIGFLFALHALCHVQKPLPDHDHALFHHYESVFRAGAAVTNAVWDKIEALFSTLENWFSDSGQFHLIGLLIHLHGKDDIVTLISTLIREARNASKTGFRKHLKARLRERVLPDWNPAQTPLGSYLENIDYGDRPRVVSVLLCFNIATLETDAGRIVRLSFHRFREESWDIEHIRATQERPPTGEKELREALNTLRSQTKSMVLKSHAGLEPGWRETMEKVLALSQEKSPFDELSASGLAQRYRQIAEALETLDDTGPRNDLANLALLDTATNRGYGAAPFFVKRQWVLSAARDGRHILPCTLAVFTKAYTEAPLNLLHWSTDDSKAYLDAISRTLTRFLTLDETNHLVGSPN